MTFVDAIHPEAVLALGYALFLLLSALGIEVVARFSHRRLRNSKTAGFRFDSEARAWQCPQGNFLWLYQVDQVIAFARSRLPADQYLEIRFEDLCANPAKIQRKVRDFIGAKHSLGALPDIDHHRIAKHDPSDERAQTIWRLCNETAVKLGYQQIGPPVCPQLPDSPSPANS